MSYKHPAHNDFLVEQQEELIAENDAFLEMSICVSEMTDRYMDAVGYIADNLICICLYPEAPAIPRWKSLTCGLCKRFVEWEFKPDNSSEHRLRCLKKAVSTVLNYDYGAILYHFKDLTVYYANQPAMNDRLIPYKPYMEAYEENKDRVMKGIITLTKLIAEQNYNKIVKYMDIFNDGSNK